MTQAVRVKLCGLRAAPDMDAAVSAGADAVGFVTASPRSAREVPLDTVRALASRLPPFVTSVAVTASHQPGDLAEIVRTCRTDAIQVTGVAGLDVLDEHRKRGDVHVLRAMRPAGPEPIEDAKELLRHADALVLDALDGAYGGTGRRLDAALAAEMVAALAPAPVILAGGLTPDNVAEAVAAVRPFGVDVSSGIETDGVKDPRRMAAFVHAAKEGTRHG